MGFSGSLGGLGWLFRMPKTPLKGVWVLRVRVLGWDGFLGRSDTDVVSWCCSRAFGKALLEFKIVEVFEGTSKKTDV